MVPEKIELLAPWSIEQSGLARIMELWNFDQNALDEFKKKYRIEWIERHGEPRTDYEKAQYEGDAIVAMIRQLSEKNGGMPKAIADLYGSDQKATIAARYGIEPDALIWDPARVTYRFIEMEGFRVWIPFD